VLMGVAVSVMVCYRVGKTKGKGDVCCTKCYGVLLGGGEGGKW